ncbi:MAG: amidase [Conexivisphaerales archaeon]
MERAEDIAGYYRKGDADPVSLVRGHLEKIKEVNKQINAFITILQERALRSAQNCTYSFRRGSDVTVACQPLAVKDIFYIKGVRCTVGSKILKDFVPDYTSTAVRRLERQGAVIVGTTNLHEFASGVTTVNPHFGATRNPWDNTRIAGGSSGGSAAAVAAALVPFALGTDTSGSIRIPAALCGVFGLKPTYGRVSKYGVFPLSKTLDHVGPIASSSWGIAAMLSDMEGYDKNDPMSRRMKKLDVKKALGSKLLVKEALVPDSLFKGPLHKEVDKAFQIFISNLKEIGVEVRHVDAEYFNHAREVWAPIRLGEALAYHYEWYKSRQADYGQDVLNRLRAAESYTAADYVRAKEKKEELTQAADKEIGDDRVFITPTVSVVAPKIGEAEVEVDGKMYEVYQLLSNFTVPFNVTGQPAISIPAFLSRENLPIGMQVVAGSAKDDLAINVAAKYEKTFGVNKRF